MAAGHQLESYMMNEHEEIETIPLVEERLSVEKREVESGHVNVRISVDEREENISVDLAKDEVEVERVPRNEPLTEIPAVRYEGETTIIPVVEEVAVVEKRLMLVEEIHVRKKSVSRTEEIETVVRSETASVERSD